jgi:DNA-binding PadR family transcriptional regulator
VKKLSHLAYIVLGVVADEQPCSGYTVMKTFQRSSSTYFSGSAGAIYPLLERLTKAKLLSVSTQEAGTRNRHSYTVTKKGMAALDAWLASPVPDEEVAFTVDLMRTRVIFFARLTKSERMKFVKDCRAQLKARIKATQERIASGEGLTPFDVASLKSVLIVDEARLAWLAVVEKDLC